MCERRIGNLLCFVLAEWSRMFPDTRLARVLLFYAVWQPLYETFAPDNVTVDAREGMPKHIDELGTAINGQSTVMGRRPLFLTT